jgi:hypothetical protein
MPTPTTTLTESRKADRAKMAQEVSEIAIAYGAVKADIIPEGIDVYNPRRVVVTITAARYLSVSVIFSAKSSQHYRDTYVLPWHIRRGEAKLSPKFGCVADCSVNMFHRQKATAVITGYTELLTHLAAVLDCVADGSAFE